MTFRDLFRGFIAAAAIGIAVPLHAQLSTSIEGFVGYYRPFGRFDPNSALMSDLPPRPSDLSAAAFGATGRLVARHRLGFAAELAATLNSRVPAWLPPTGGLPTDPAYGPTNATVSMGMLQAQYDVSPQPQAYHVWLNAGPGFVHHGGDAYRHYGSPTSFAAAFGTTIAVPIGVHWQLVTDATALFYAFHMSTPSFITGADIERGNQRDALLHLGLGWTLH
jgi:hypothetical protein